jgi:hypothetical protein
VTAVVRALPVTHARKPEDTQVTTAIKELPLSLEEAKEQRVCRFCRRSEKLNDLPTDRPFVFNFGKEYAHRACINVGVRERIEGMQEHLDKEVEGYKHRIRKLVGELETLRNQPVRCQELKASMEKVKELSKKILKLNNDLATIYDNYTIILEWERDLES